MKINEVSLHADLKTYIATLCLKIEGASFLVRTSVSAEGPQQAHQLLSAVYGRRNVVGLKQLVVEDGADLPLNADQLKVQTLAKAKERAADALKAERARQKQSRAQVALAKATQAQRAALQP